MKRTVLTILASLAVVIAAGPARAQPALLETGIELSSAAQRGLPQLVETLEALRHTRGASVLRGPGGEVAGLVAPEVRDPDGVLALLEAIENGTLELDAIQSSAARRLLNNGRFRGSLTAALNDMRLADETDCLGITALEQLQKEIDEAASLAAESPTDLAFVAADDRARWFGRLNEVAGSNTTTLRRETKFVRPSDLTGADFQPATGFAADNSGLKRVMRGKIVEPIPLLDSEGMQAFFGPRLRLRDAVEPGTLNETYTTYARPIRFQVRDRKTGETLTLVSKYRNRQYRIIDETTGELISRAPITSQSQFAEFKVDARIPGVVTKHRFRGLDQDIEILRDANRFWGALRRQTEAPIESRVKVLEDEANYPVISKMFETIDLLHVDGASLEPFVDVAYVRSSYELPLTDTAGESVKVQITIDQDIRYIDPASGKIIGTYPSGSRVVEIKVPVEYSGLTDADLAAVPGLARVREFVEAVEGAPSYPGYVDGSGKFINYRKGNYQPVQ